MPYQTLFLEAGTLGGGRGILGEQDRCQGRGRWTTIDGKMKLETIQMPEVL